MFVHACKKKFLALLLTVACVFAAVPAIARGFALTPGGFTANESAVKDEAEENEYEVELTDQIIKQGGNGADLSFSFWGNSRELDLLRRKWSLVSAVELVSTPAGTTDFLTGQPDQLPGRGTGATFTIPFDIADPAVRGATGTEHSLTLTAEQVGKCAFDNLIAFLKSERTASPERFSGEDGLVFYMPHTARVLFEKIGISVMVRFSNGTVRDASNNFQLGALYDEDMFDRGALTVVFGTIFVDSAPKNGEYWLDVTDEMLPDGSPVKFAIVRDGADDGAIKISYWLAENRHRDGGGGCSTSAFFPAMMVLLASALFLKKR